MSCDFKKVIKSNPYDRWEKFFDRNFFFDLMHNDDNVELLEGLVSDVLINVDFTNIDFVGISTGNSISLFEIHFSMVLGKLIQAIHKGEGDQVYKSLDGAIYYNEENKLLANTESKPSFCCPDFDNLNVGYYIAHFHPSDNKNNIEQYFGWPFPYNIFANNINRLRYKDIASKEVFLPYYFNFYCPYNCAFCEQSALNKVKPCSKKVENVISDIEILKSKYNTKYIHFVNNTFNYNAKFAREFLENIIDRNIKIYWSDCARANNLTTELLELMYQAGCRKLVFGFETGSEKILQYIN